MDKTDAAAAATQSGDNESDPDLDLWSPTSRVGNTFWCQCGECVARDRRQDCVCCFHCVECGKKSLLSFEGLHVHVDLQLSRSTCHCFHASSFSYVFLTVLSSREALWTVTKRPLIVSHNNKRVEIFGFSPLALLCPVDGSFIHHCIFSTSFGSFRAVIEVNTPAT